MRLLRANVIACRINASVVVGFDRNDSLFLTSCVTVGSDLRKTLGTWYLCCGGVNVPGRTHFLTDFCMSGRSVSLPVFWYCACSSSAACCGSGPGRGASP